MTQNGRAFLFGAGTSKCAALPLMDELTATVLAGKLDEKSKAAISAVQGEFEGATDSNIEDFLSELVDYLAVAERRAGRGGQSESVSIGDSKFTGSELRAAVEQVKDAIGSAIDVPVPVDTHRRFVSAVHRALRPGKPTPGQVVDYIVLNYDTLVEDSLALERVPYADGMDGGATGWWDSATFEREEIRARVLKVHGSIDWCEIVGDPLPRRLGKNMKAAEGDNHRRIIWPATTKYRETQLDPFAQLSTRMRNVLRPPAGSQCVLGICGYGFNDSHINLEIENALRASERRLTAVVFTADESPAGEVARWRSDPELSEQIVVYAKRGFFHGEVEESADEDLPWWSFEDVVGLLEGGR